MPTWSSCGALPTGVHCVCSVAPAVAASLPCWRAVPLTSPGVPTAHAPGFPHPPCLRERQEGQETSLHQLRKALAAAEEQAAAAAAAAAATATASAGSAEADAAHLANVSAEAAALRQRCRRAEHDLEALRQEAEAAYAERSSAAAEVAHLRQQLQQRDAEVAQLRLQVCGHGGMCAGRGCLPGAAWTADWNVHFFP